MNAIKLKSIQNSMVSAKNNSAWSVSIFKAYSRFHTLNKDSFSAFANNCHWFVAKTSKYTEHLLLVLIITLEETVLKVIRIFLHQPVDNGINLVILSIIVAHITCKTTVLVNFDKQKLSNCKTQEKLTDKYSYLPSFAYRLPRPVVVSLPYCTNSNLLFKILPLTIISHSPFPIPRFSNFPCQIYKTCMQINKTASNFAVNHFFLSNFGR